MAYQRAEFLTTKELAELLRIKERRVYDLAASGDVPCSRATGKLLFPRKAIDQWLVENGSGFSKLRRSNRPAVIGGSHDPLLEWALRASDSGLASLFDRSDDGLMRFKEGGAVGVGLHLFMAEGEQWNVPFVAEGFDFRHGVLTEWAWRERGLIVARGNPLGLKDFGDLKGAKIIPRQAGAGAAYLFEKLILDAKLDASKLDLAAPQRSEVDAAQMIGSGGGDVTFGLAAVAAQLQLDFVPILRERYDLLVCRKGWFDKEFQALKLFTSSEEFAAKARSLKGYDISGQWQVHYNGN